MKKYYYGNMKKDDGVRHTVTELKVLRRSRKLEKIIDLQIACKCDIGFGKKKGFHHLFSPFVV